ncbi:MAG: alpha/beta hydrolase [Verrucomicrobiota bacterium]|nr:alpha/beta hydrolase [Verrucomicrobiota bacterium]
MPRPRAAEKETRPSHTLRHLIFDIVLLTFAALVCGASLLVLLPAPTSALWITAIIVTEWGHFVTLFCLLLAIAILQRRSSLAHCAAALLLVAAMLCVVPVARAVIVASTLPARSAAAFGGTHQSTREPLSVVDLFRGVVSGNVNVTEHIYGSAGSKNLKLDLYQSAPRAAAQPLVVMIHGGSWSGGNKRELPALNRFLASHGYTVAAINYRHAPAWRWPGPVEDVFRAVDYLRANAAEFGIDANNIVLIGRSAGGQIALSAAYANRDSAIRGVVSFYAPVDLALAYAQPSAPGVLDSCRVLRDYLGGTPAEVPDAYANASPINFVAEGTPPTLLIHGGLDPIVAPVHSELLMTRLQDSARPVLYLYLPWATHGCDANLSGPSGQLSLYVIERFLGSVLPTGERPNG